MTTLLPWLGALLLLSGLCITPLLKRLPANRFVELLVLALLACGLTWLWRRVRTWPMASVLALLWIAILPVFACPLPVLATALLLLAAIAAGQMLFPRYPLALQGTLGLLLCSALLGWTLLLPIHLRWVYLPACGALLAWRLAPLRMALQSAATHWRHAVARAPRSAAFAILMLGLASTACWLPTLQYDDLAYHLRLPWQLMEQGVYRPAPEHQVWALAPWAADVIQAVPQVMAGSESRGPVNMVWLALLAAACWRLAAALGASVMLRWLAVAMVASLPLTAGLAAGMQTELPTAAVLLWMCVLAAAPRHEQLSFWLALAILAGGLMALKLMAALMAVPVLAWALVRHPWPSPARIGMVLLLGLTVGGASYAHAAWISGNPVLPLFNGLFQSPHFAPVNFSDPRYHSGFSLDLPWSLTFWTSRHFESHDGAAGVALVALAGLWLLSLLRPATRAAALVATAVLALPLLPVQYLRYAYPGMVMLCVVSIAALGSGALRRPMVGLLVTICLLNLGFQANGYWMLRSGALKESIRNGGRSAPLFERYAPERLLAIAIRDSGEHHGTVLVLDQNEAFFAEFGTRGRTVAWYAPALQSAAKAAALDPSGERWAALLHEQQVKHVIVRVETLAEAQLLALQRLNGTLRSETGGRQWWSLPDPTASP